MKEAGTTHWNSPNTDATNESGWTGLPGGFRQAQSGDFYWLGEYSLWWSSQDGFQFREAEFYPDRSPVIEISNDDSESSPRNPGKVGRGGWYKRTGLSVRCIKD